MSRWFFVSLQAPMRAGDLVARQAFFDGDFMTLDERCDLAQEMGQLSDSCVWRPTSTAPHFFEIEGYASMYTSAAQMITRKALGVQDNFYLIRNQEAGGAPPKPAKIMRLNKFHSEQLPLP